jgi:hypothetical protein
MKTVTVGNLLKSGIATLNDPTKEGVHSEIHGLPCSTFPVIDTTDLWAATERLVNIPDVFVSTMSSTWSESTSRAIVQDGPRAPRISTNISTCRAIFYHCRGPLSPDLRLKPRKIDWVILGGSDAIAQPWMSNHVSSGIDSSSTPYPVLSLLEQ